MKFFFVIAMILLSVGCSHPSSISSDTISPAEMEKILWDMILAERYSAQFLQKDSAKLNPKLETFKMYEEIFQIHKTSREKFIKSYKFYLSRPDISKMMFDSLAARANRSRAEIFNRAK